MARAPTWPRQLGATLIEFSLVAMPLLLLSMLILEAAHWQMVRQIAYVALLESARAGSTQARRANVMEQAFAHAFLPRFINAGSDAAKAQHDTWNRIERRTDLPPWRIEILRPGDTDLLHTRLSYLHEPLSPLTRALVRHLGKPTGDCAQRAWAHGLLTIRLSLHIEMHSRPAQGQTTTPDARLDRVVYGAWKCAGKPQRR